MKSSQPIISAPELRKTLAWSGHVIRIYRRTYGYQERRRFRTTQYSVTIDNENPSAWDSDFGFVAGVAFLEAAGYPFEESFSTLSPLNGEV